MPLAKSHSLPNKRDRKAKNYNITSSTSISKAAQYQEAEDMIDQIYADICNGVSKFDCLQKIERGVYGKEVKKRQAQHYYNAAFERLAYNSDIEAEKLRQLLYTRYETLLEECVKKGDMYNARGILDSMARIFGVERKTPDTAIMINSDKEGGVTVNFGFNKNEEINED